MKLVRKTIFWLHLVVGVVVGLGVAFMAGTGLLMAFEHPILEKVESFDGRAPETNAKVQSIENMLESAMLERPDANPTGLTAWPDLNRPTAVQYGKEKVLYLNNYTTKVVGTEATGLRSFFHTVEELHRWLAATGDWRNWGRNTTGVVNLGFLTLVLSGLWLWFPRRLKWKSFKPVLVPNLRLTGKTRDWNWHNVVGFWMLVPLAVIVLTGTIMSYTWAGNLVYRAVGETPPAPRNGGGPGGGEQRQRGGANGQPRAGGEGRREGGGARQPFNTEGLNDLWDSAEAASPGWTSIAIRFGGGRRGGGGENAQAGAGQSGGGEGGDSPRGVTFAVSYGNSLSPVNRVTLTYNQRSGELLSTQTFSDQTLGRRLKALNLPIHRGEVLGLPGMALAAACCISALVLVYTGFALSWRRLARPVLKRVRDRRWARASMGEPINVPVNVPVGSEAMARQSAT